MDVPRVIYNEPKYDVDEVLNTLESHGAINPKFKQDSKELLLKNRNCHTICGLLLEFDELWNYGDSQSMAKKRGISRMLMDLESPILFFVD